MVFHPRHCVISSKAVNQVADDIIQIATYSKQKDKLRNAMMVERLKTSNHHSMLTEYEIQQMTYSLSKSYVKPEAVAVSLRKIGRSLRKQYQQISNIIGELR